MKRSVIVIRRYTLYMVYDMKLHKRESHLMDFSVRGLTLSDLMRYNFIINKNVY